MLMMMIMMMRLAELSPDQVVSSGELLPYARPYARP